MKAFTAGLLVAFGVGLLAFGLGLGGTNQREPYPIRPATHQEVQLHDLHASLELTRVCAGSPRDVWPCNTVGGDVR